MTDPTRETDDDGGVVDDRKPVTGVPRWVELVAIGEAVVVLVLVLVVVLLLGRGDCGGGGGYSPGHHGSGGFGGQAPPAAVTQALASSGSGHV